MSDEREIRLDEVQQLQNHMDGHSIAVDNPDHVIRRFIAKRVEEIERLFGKKEEEPAQEAAPAEEPIPTEPVPSQEPQAPEEEKPVGA